MNKKVRIEIRFDEEKDKEMIDFIDEYGSTRAGFIKQVLKMYKSQVEESKHAAFNNVPKKELEKEKSKKKKKKLPVIDISYSSKDFS